MEQMIPSTHAAAGDELAAAGSPRLADHWQRRFGVPWERVDRAARAVLDRAAAASRRRYADLSAEIGAGQLSTKTRLG